MNLKHLTDNQLLYMWNNGNPITIGIGKRDDLYTVKVEWLREELRGRNLISC